MTYTFTKGLTGYPSKGASQEVTKCSIDVDDWYSRIEIHGNGDETDLRDFILEAITEKKRILRDTDYDEGEQAARNVQEKFMGNSRAFWDGFQDIMASN